MRRTNRRRCVVVGMAGGLLAGGLLGGCAVDLIEIGGGTQRASEDPVGGGVDDSRWGEGVVIWEREGEVEDEDVFAGDGGE